MSASRCSWLTLVVVVLLCYSLADCTTVGEHPERSLLERNGSASAGKEKGGCNCSGQPLGLSPAPCGTDRTTFCNCSEQGCRQLSCPPGTLFDATSSACAAALPKVERREQLSRDFNGGGFGGGGFGGGNSPRGDPPPREQPTVAPKVQPTTKAPVPTPDNGRSPNNPTPVTSAPVTPSPQVATPSPTAAPTSAPTAPAVTPSPPAVSPSPPAVTPSPTDAPTTAPPAVTPAPTPTATTSTPAPTTSAPNPTATPVSTSNTVQTPSVVLNVTSNAPAPYTNATAQTSFSNATSSSPSTNASATAVTASTSTSGATSNSTLPYQTTPRAGSKQGSSSGVIIAVVVVVIVLVALLAIGIGICCCCREAVLGAFRRKRKGLGPYAAPNPRSSASTGFLLPLARAPAGQSASGLGPNHGAYISSFANSDSSNTNTPTPRRSPAFSKVALFSYGELQEATSNFSGAKLLGEGGFGMVYAGRLSDGRPVAVKRATAGRTESSEQFGNEVDLLSRVHHRHLVSLLGYCQQGGEQLLVYELMAQGSLSNHLYGNGDPLSWQQRVKVALGAARALEYLHVGADPPIIHRDIKTDNILLDANFNAKVADFGLSRLPPNQEYSVSLETMPSAIKGTLGYLDPDYVIGNPITTKSDVYSFGVVLIQLITGRPAVDLRATDGCRSLVDWARPFLRARTFDSLVDPRLHGRFSKQDLVQLCTLAGRCLEKNPLRRPSMTEVVRVLGSLEETASISLAPEPQRQIFDTFPGLNRGESTTSEVEFSRQSGSTSMQSSAQLSRSGESTEPPSGRAGWSGTSTGPPNILLGSYVGQIGELTMSQVLGR